MIAVITSMVPDRSVVFGWQELHNDGRFCTAPDGDPPLRVSERHKDKAVQPCGRQLIDGDVMNGYCPIVTTECHGACVRGSLHGVGADSIVCRAVVEHSRCNLAAPMAPLQTCH